MDDLKTPLTNIKQIDTSTREGRLLFAAIGKIQAKCCPDKSVNQILEDLDRKARHIFEHDNNK